MLKVVLVDDEIAAIRTLELLLKQCCYDIQIVGTARSVQEAIKIVDSQKPDLVFLDIQMPQGSGFDLLEHIPEHNFEIIFITAYNQYAIRAFKYSAVDYILKPIDIDELANAIEKAQNLLKKKTSTRARYSVLFENLKGLVPNKIVIPQKNSFHTIDLSQVYTIKITNNGASFYMANSSIVSCSLCLENFSQLIQDKGFVEVKPKVFVNLQKVIKVEKAGKGFVILENGESISLESITKENFIDNLSLKGTKNT
ncbi:MAG TPA: response regulator [Tenuifilaceae bacterium]|nr:response regulator [Tenuifilaceae bacterium]HPE18875.1 response regulator [Tenuifilaceae bacterium]HPJ46334.1 response regulator [Tenuifilaceae bacterium]HPQ35031.1 response regulator [Tenuifilaceae bacterium]HRX68346.1 response regulator [Tenuifilaceae bacterium]